MNSIVLVMVNNKWSYNMDTEKYIPKFTHTDKNQNGDITLWVKMPNNYNREIWDLSRSQVDIEILHAITSAFEIGMSAQQQLIETYIPVVSAKSIKKLYKDISNINI